MDSQEGYYEINKFEDKDIYKFKSISDNVLNDIKSIILAQNDYIEAVEPNTELNLNDSFHFTDVELAIRLIAQILTTDIKDNEKESLKNGWDFYYFIGNSPIKQDAVLILANLYFPEKTSTKRNVIYNVIAIRKIDSQFYIWNML